MKSLRPLLLPALLVSLLSACVSQEPAQPAVVQLVQSELPLDLADVDGRIAIRVREGETVVTIDDRAFICRGFAGWIGRIDTHHGWLKVGKLEFGYDPDKVWVRGPRSWSTFPREGEQNHVVSQDGAVARSVFKG